MARTATKMQEQVQEQGGYAMSDEHKANLATGREQARIVRSYLEAVQYNKPKRGRKVTPESLENRLNAIVEQLEAEYDPLRRLTLISERDALAVRLEQVGTEIDMTELEEEFIAVAAEYASRRGIAYSAWRTVGVPPSVLRAAGIAR